jgi:hypothetical protein
LPIFLPVRGLPIGIHSSGIRGRRGTVHIGLPRANL